MLTCIRPKIMMIKPNPSLKRSYNEVLRNLQNETVSWIFVFEFSSLNIDINGVFDFFRYPVLEEPKVP